MRRAHSRSSIRSIGARSRVRVSVRVCVGDVRLQRTAHAPCLWCGVHIHVSLVWRASSRCLAEQQAARSQLVIEVYEIVSSYNSQL